MSIQYLHPYLSYRHYPAVYGKHIHAELASIRHDELLREHAELERYYRNNCQLFVDPTAPQYQHEIRERSVRLAEMRDRSRILAQLQRDRLEGLILEEDLRSQQTLREMQVDRYLRGKYLAEQNDRKRLNSNSPSLDYLQKQSNIDRKYKSEKKYINLSESRRYQHQSENKRALAGFHTNGLLQSQALKRSAEPQHNLSQLQSCLFKSLKRTNSNSHQKLKEKGSILKNRPKAHVTKNGIPSKKARKVTFSLEKTARQRERSLYSNPAALPRSPQSKNQSKLKGQQVTDITHNSMKRIRNRLNLSTVIYKDARWKNTKHELQHLFSTIQNENKMRQEISAKISNHPQIVAKYHRVADGR